MKWGLILPWAKDPKEGARMNNARGETVAEKPSFRAAFKRKRCIVPMAGFYEWKATPIGKIPHYFTMLNADQFAAAGIWEQWNAPDGQVIESYAIITTEANAVMAPVHDRMPVILSERDIEEWLNPGNVDGHGLHKLLVPYPADEMQEREVSTRVNSSRNEGQELLD
jgi:putative SOS response-associated peptidase YedK